MRPQTAAPRTRCRPASVAAFLLVVLALCGHFGQGLHFLRHVHAVVGGKIVHHHHDDRAPHEHRVAKGNALPDGLRIDEGHRHGDCQMPPQDRVRDTASAIPLPHFGPAPQPIAVGTPREHDSARAVLSYAPKHSPPADDATLVRLERRRTAPS
ncbi:MAG: hypothetical protein HZB39_01675 [Planctomycetes bacterium]|nr:hypothetical protein [Planctomycetota bacterium]